MTDTEAEREGKPSRPKQDAQIGEVLKGMRAELESSTPEMLAGLAAAARSVAERLEEMAENARLRREAKKGVPEPGEQSAPAELPENQSHEHC